MAYSRPDSIPGRFPSSKMLSVASMYCCRKSTARVYALFELKEVPFLV